MIKKTLLSFFICITTSTLVFAGNTGKFFLGYSDANGMASLTSVDGTKNYKVLFKIEPTLDDGVTPSDPLTVECSVSKDSKSASISPKILVYPGTSYMCENLAGTSVKYLITAANFKHGTVGTVEIFQ